MPKGFVSEYISLDTKSYNAIKQAYRKLSKSSDRSIGVVCSGGGGPCAITTLGNFSSHT